MMILQKSIYFLMETLYASAINDAEIISRLIDGNFPDYKQLIPKEPTTQATVKKEDFMRITKIAGLFARDSGGGVTINLDENTSQISIHSIASEVGENTRKQPRK